jgi:hypothetical protein
VPRRNDVSSGAAGREAVAIHRDVDFTDVIAIVEYLPTLATEKGTAYAIRYARRELRSKLALLKLADPTTKEDAKAQADVAFYFNRGVLRLLVEPSDAGDNQRDEFLDVVQREFFEPSVRAVFKKTAASSEEKYVPLIPQR